MPSWAQDIMTMYRSRVKGDEITLRDCPYCHNSRWNFQISVNGCMFHCWVCGAGKGETVASLLRQAQIPFDPADIKIKRRAEEGPAGSIVLPNNRKLLYNDTRIAIMARNYMLSRDVDEALMEDWDMRIGLGEDKEKWGMDYFGWTVVPFYGLYGLEYFMAVNSGFTNKYSFPDKDKFPELGKDKFIPKRRGSDSIILVEGLFDATSAWKYTDLDVFPLFGKFIGSKQKELLLKVNYEKIYVCLDADAIKEGMDLAETLYREGGNAYIVCLPDDSDPNELGERINIYIDSAIKFGLTTRLRLTRMRLLSV